MGGKAAQCNKITPGKAASQRNYEKIRFIQVYVILDTSPMTLIFTSFRAQHEKIFFQIAT